MVTTQEKINIHMKTKGAPVLLLKALVKVTQTAIIKLNIQIKD